jgi:hypothetical protein
MAYHSESGSDFVGLRILVGGRKQVVCENERGKRVLLDICDLSASDAKINDALKEGIGAQNVLGGVVAALKARNIAVEFAG